LQATITQAEYHSWLQFYREEPFDDFHRYHRPAALVARSMGGGDIDEYLQWLQPPVWQEDLSTADIRTMRALGISKE
jgi:hypothetical protein